MSENIKLHKNGAKGMLISDKQPITGKQAIRLVFTTNEEVIEFHKTLGEFINKNCK